MTQLHFYNNCYGQHVM